MTSPPETETIDLTPDFRGGLRILCTLAAGGVPASEIEKHIEDLGQKYDALRRSYRHFDQAIDGIAAIESHSCPDRDDGFPNHEVSLTLCQWCLQYDPR